MWFKPYIGQWMKDSKYHHHQWVTREAHYWATVPKIKQGSISATPLKPNVTKDVLWREREQKSYVKGTLQKLMYIRKDSIPGTQCSVFKERKWCLCSSQTLQNRMKLKHKIYTNLALSGRWSEGGGDVGECH